MNNQCRLILARALSIIVVIGLSVFIFAIRKRVESLDIYGYPVIFLLSFMAYATVFLPAPGIAVIFSMDTSFHPLSIALAAGTGAALGELSGYLVGFSGRAVIEHREIYERLTRWMEKHGSLTILVMSAIPNPLFDVAGVAAGMLKMPVWNFLLFCWIGELIKMTVFAYSGTALWKFLQGWM
jgi:membrane protein DedA with SNARE-associated domain